MLGLVEDYERLDEAVGTMEDFRVFLKTFHKKGVKVVVTFNFNAISINHKWIGENKVKLKSFEDPYNNKISRYGKAIDVDIDGKKYYSVFGSPNVDLDLTDPDTQKQIINVINMWMKEGIDGILLDNAAFFVEEEENVQRKPNSMWNMNCQNSQMYRNGSVTFVKAIKQEIDKWTNESGKFKLLAVSSGETGCGVYDDPDPMLMFRNVTDMIISREWLFDRGGPFSLITPQKQNIEKFYSYPTSDREKLGLTTSTTETPSYFEIFTLAPTLLLPGIPIIYYGTEIGFTTFDIHRLPKEIYPKGKIYNDRDETLYTLSHSPMPWDRTGRRFSANINETIFIEYLKDIKWLSVVEDQLAEGNNQSFLHLVRKLVALRQNPSIKWGTMELIDIADVDIPILNSKINLSKPQTAHHVLVFECNSTNPHSIIKPQSTKETDS
ncbi:unnamed protein product [Schistosoma turkestanicum]|nr:unnamed protein product [Schistosoma turkestanicum]